MSVVLDVLKRAAPAVLIEYRRYFKVFGRFPNLRRPTRLSERVMARKLFDRNPLHTLCADKFLVRDYVANRIGSDVLVPLLFQTARPSDLNDLPLWARTVIKPNHASMAVNIMPATEPSAEDKYRIIEQCEQWLSLDYSKVYNEWHYSGIERRILVEKFVCGGSRSPVEIKVHCFAQPRGTVEHIIQLVGDRFGRKSMAFYVKDEAARFLRVHELGERPPNFDDLEAGQLAEAVHLSTLLCRDFDYVRVDWLSGGGCLYFSELTFTPGAGLSTSFGDALDRQAGSMWRAVPRHGQVILPDTAASNRPRSETTLPHDQVLHTQMTQHPGVIPLNR